MSQRPWVGLSLLLLTAAGCADMWPDIYHPGPEGYQRLRAQRADPYPQPDIGPEVVGGRPREYDKPEPEPLRVVPPQFKKQYRP